MTYHLLMKSIITKYLRNILKHIFITYLIQKKFQVVEQRHNIIYLQPTCQIKAPKTLCHQLQSIPCAAVDAQNAKLAFVFKDLDNQSLNIYVDKVEDILESKEWTEFADNLNNNIGLDVCYEICGETKQQKTETYIMGNKEVKVEH